MQAVSRTTSAANRAWQRSIPRPSRDRTRDRSPGGCACAARSLAGGGLIATGGMVGRALAQQSAPAVITSERMRPSLPYGVQTGDLAGDRAILWACADRP